MTPESRKKTELEIDNKEKSRQNILTARGRELLGLIGPLRAETIGSHGKPRRATSYFQL